MATARTQRLMLHAWVLLSTLGVTIGEFFVPWIRSELLVSDQWWPLYVPVKIGLVKCFGNICALNNFFRQNNGGQAPPMSARVREQQVPFIVASCLVLVFMTACLCLYCRAVYMTLNEFDRRADTMAAANSESSKQAQRQRHQQGGSIQAADPEVREGQDAVCCRGEPFSALQWLGIGAVCNVLAIAAYAIATLPVSRHAAFLAGFWMCLGTAIAGLISFVFAATLSPRAEYDRIPGGLYDSPSVRV